MLLRTIKICTISLMVFVTTAAGQDEKDLWQAFHLLEGRWSGQGLGFGNVSDVTHEWEFILQRQFLRLKTKSVNKGQQGTGEIHEDIGFLSYDKDHGSFVFRQFLTEGFVNTFDVSTENNGTRRIQFGFRESESAGGMRVRMYLEFLSETEYAMVLELAAKGEEFSPCQRMKMKKVEQE